MREPAVSFLEQYEDLDPWAAAEHVVAHLVAESQTAAERAPACDRTPIAFGIFRAKVEREITALLERVRELEEHLEGGLK